MRVWLSTWGCIWAISIAPPGPGLSWGWLNTRPAQCVCFYLGAMSRPLGSCLCLRPASLSFWDFWDSVTPIPVPAPDVTGVPVCYYNLKVVFSEARASSLPPHRSYDCAIDLLPGTSPPKGCLYSLSVPERDNIYICAWQRGSSGHHLHLQGWVLFFVAKNDGTLCPCIDNRGLNKISVKNYYPLLLVS